MKVLLYGLNYSPEKVGIGKYSGELTRSLVSQGHQIRVITAPPYFPSWRVASGHSNRYSVEQVEGVLVRRCPSGSTSAQWPHTAFASRQLCPLQPRAVAGSTPLAA